jgi:F0F1-type ATP synthase epsilon subunit
VIEARFKPEFTAQTESVLALRNGTCGVSSDRVDILTDMAVTAANIDEAKAEEARQRG